MLGKLLCGDLCDGHDGGGTRHRELTGRGSRAGASRAAEKHRQGHQNA